ncbi:MAG TPA: DUF6805 domain-containing protein [Verrucomicrobiae bacterium]|jgi:hypothetical protein
MKNKSPILHQQPNPGVVGASGDWLSALHPVGSQPATFTGAVFRVPGDEQAESLTLEPFYKIYRRSYEVYWDQYTPEQWQVREKDFAAKTEKQRLADARTVDSVRPGEEQNERDHNQQGDKTSSGDFSDHFYRDATAGGWFSWDLKVLPNAPQNLVLTYWGADRGRQFDVLVDGQMLAAERLNATHPGVFFDQVYPLPPGLTRAKEKITLRLQGSDTYVGGVFGVRVVKAEPKP